MRDSIRLVTGWQLGLAVILCQSAAFDRKR